MPQKLPKFILIYDCEDKQFKLKISYSTILRGDREEENLYRIKVSYG
ncbi:MULTISPECIES: hypothetical protein [Microcystis]|nr:MULTISPECIES: hypothetical protein [Microcystis]MCA2876531.1 hypothetical protein [Microcystis sp. M051S1]MCA2894681.1 hypothetical protein [Microcystis sp. M048S1]MCA2724229.1 hypothetical protein [Microcystis sp. M176S2]MCA2747525.1 hypothetical protein [Microcystis sp. M155S2]MCA2768723.1 hypothetical protein [Microcystis sp. M152S2]